ncbi:MAG: alpha/beta hydrolase-fold protein, partial [Bacteroidota bacterium]
FFVFFFLGAILIANAQQSPLKQRIIDHTLYSTILGEDRKVTVFLPNEYHSEYAKQDKYCVVYVLDGGKKKTIVKGVYDFLANGPKPTIPDLIIVAVHQKNRMKELTPSTSLKYPNGEAAVQYKSSGGGNLFYNFLTTELNAFIDKSYRTNGYNILAGHSFGGLFSLDALLTKNGVFKGFIASDPSLWWNDKNLYKKSMDLLESKDFDRHSLFLAIANQEGTPTLPHSNMHQETIHDFAKLLDATKPDGLRYRHKFYEDRDHLSLSMESLQDGLSFLFEGFAFRFRGLDLTKESLTDNYKKVSENTGITLEPSIARLIQYGDLFLIKNDPKRALLFYEYALKRIPKDEKLLKKVSEVKSKLKLNP